MSTAPTDQRSLRLEPVLSAPTLDGWLATHLAARFDRWEEEAALTEPAQVVPLPELLADDAAVLRSIHTRLTADGTPAPAAASYLADWFAGMVAGTVGYSLATAGAGLLVDGADLGFHLHPDGWPIRLDLQAAALVLADHPWAASVRTEVVGSAAELLERTVQRLVDATAPIIHALHGTARVGLAGLWNEVGDALGATLAFQRDVEATPSMVAVLAAAVGVAGAPWKARPRLEHIDSEALGRVHVAQKGGCCLAYTRPRTDVPTADDPGLAPYRRAYLARFPVDPDAPRYCSTCSFRDPADTDARQVFWHEHHA
jgi:hypothetical protein